MIKLTHILKEVFVEASLQNDAQQGKKANSYIDRMKKLVANYKRDTKEIQIKGVHGVSGLLYIHLDLGDLEVDILPTDKGNNKGKFLPAHGSNKPQIELYNNKIESTNNGLVVQVDEKTLYHELVHFFDYQKVKVDPTKLDKGYNKAKQKRGYAGYINDPLEVNAHFFEYFMDSIVKMIEKQKEVPVTFDEFQKDIMKDPKAKGFLEDLDDKNKRKVMKRLGTYYNDILKNPDFKIQNGDKIDDTRLKKATTGFISKIKSFFKAA